MEKQNKWKELGLYFSGCVKWLALAVLVGVLVGACGTAFGVGLHWATQTRTANPWLIWLLPLAGVGVVTMYRTAGQPGGGSVNAAFVAVRTKVVMPLVTAPLIFIATIVTHLFGGSAGREGAGLLLGGSLAGQLGKLLRLDDTDCRMMTMCGMAAVFSAIFGTPLAAVVFTLEVGSVGTMYYAALVPCLVAALTALGVAGLAGLEPTAFALTQTVAMSPASVAKVLVLATLAGGLSILFCELLHAAPRLYAKAFPNPYIRAAAGGALVAVLTFLLHTTDYNGAGEHVIHAAIAGQAVPWAFVLKMLFTALTLGAGLKGGEIVPLFFTGATFGCAIAPLLGLPAGFGAAIGLVALFCGATNAPLASVFLAAELFGGQCLPLFALACAVSYGFSGYFSLYSEQRFIFSKLRAEPREHKDE